MSDLTIVNNSKDDSHAILIINKNGLQKLLEYSLSYTDFLESGTLIFGKEFMSKIRKLDYDRNSI